MPKTDDKLLTRAKAMRTEMTQPERELWIALRRNGSAMSNFRVRS